MCGAWEGQGGWMGGRGELSKAGYSEVWTDQGDYCKQFTRVIECLPNLL